MLRFPSEFLVGVVSNQEVDHFLSASSLEEQREIFDHWPLDKFRDAYRFVFYKRQKFTSIYFS